jgi:hypothetical protein
MVIELKGALAPFSYLVVKYLESVSFIIIELVAQ